MTSQLPGPRTCLTTAELERVNYATAHRAQRISDKLAAAMQLVADPRKAERLDARMCCWCFYGESGFAGQGFTRWACQLCGVENQHSNTAVPKLCGTCSDAFGLCYDCGADIELRHRMKRERKAKRAGKRGA